MKRSVEGKEVCGANVNTLVAPAFEMLNEQFWLNATEDMNKNPSKILFFMGFDFGGYTW